MAHFEKSIDIAVPPEQVWAYIVQGTTTPVYMPMVTDFAFTREVRYEPGDRFKMKLKVRGVEMPIEYEVTEEVVPQRLTFTSIAGMRNTTTWELTPIASGTRVTFRSDYEMPGSFVGAIVDRLVVENAMKAGVSEALENLKRILETGQAA